MKMQKALCRASDLYRLIKTDTLAELYDERMFNNFPRECDLFCVLADFGQDPTVEHSLGIVFDAFASLDDLKTHELQKPRLRIFPFEQKDQIIAALSEQFGEGQNDTSIYTKHREDASLIWITHMRQG